MVRGPWHILVDEDPESNSYTATLSLDEGQGPSFHSEDRETAIQAVKDRWSAELHEHFADQDFVVTDVSEPETSAAPPVQSAAPQP